MVDINFILAMMSEEFNSLIDEYQTPAHIDYKVMKDLSVKLATDAHLIIFECNQKIEESEQQ